MTTIAAGNHAQIYFDHLDDIVITPGSGGTVKFDCSTPNSAATRPTARTIYSAATISIPAGSTVFLSAEVADATYTHDSLVVAADSTGAIDTASAAALAASGVIATKSQMTIGILGDSIAEGMTARIPLPEADTGWFADCSAAASTFLIAAHCAYGCAGGAAVLVDWDGSRYMRAQVSADGYGAWVDVTGGGYFALPTGSGKYVFVKVRWRLRPAANTWSFTNQAVGTLTWCRQFSGDFFGGALMAANMQHHTILNYAIGGDWAADMLNRVDQVIAREPDAVLLMAGRNDAANSTDPSASLIGILDALTAAGIYVMYVDTIPNNYTAGAQVNAWIASMNYMRATIPTRYRGMVDMVDMALPYGSPTGAAGTALVDTNKFADNIHSSIVGTWGASAQIGANALRARFPNASWIRRVNGADAYNASTNPSGNMVGVRASLTGSTGTTSATGVTTLTGSIPTNWSESQQTGTFATITYTEPSNASPVARGGNYPGNWWRMVATNTSGANAARYLYCNLESAPVAGSYHRFGITLRLTNATALRNLEVFLSLGGVSNLAPSLIKIGAATPIAAATLSDSGVMVLVSEPYKMPAGVASAQLYIQVGCATAGGFTLDIADPWVALA